MPRQPVRFGIRHHNLTQMFDRTRLRLGLKLYVLLNENEQAPVQISIEEEPSSVPHWVQWIAPSEWYVILEPRYQVPIAFIERTTQAVQPFLDSQTVENAMRQFASQIRPQYQHKTSEFERNPLSVIFSVLERLELALGVSTQPTNAPGWVRTEPLQSYLLLTCFDRLGQPAEWMDFGTWLTTKASADTVSDLARRQPKLDRLAFTKNLYAEYQSVFGTKNSFFRFVQEILPQDAREILVHSVEITRLSVPPSVKPLPPPSDLEKIQYLYKLRNEYTHKAGSVASAGEWYGRTYASRRQIFGETSWSDTTTHGWPAVLERCVRQGLAKCLARAAEPDSISPKSANKSGM